MLNPAFALAIHHPVGHTGLRQRSPKPGVRRFAWALLLWWAGQIKPHQQRDGGLRAVGRRAGADEPRRAGGDALLQIEREGCSPGAGRAEQGNGRQCRHGGYKKTAPQRGVNCT